MSTFHFCLAKNFFIFSLDRVLVASLPLSTESNAAIQEWASASSHDILRLEKHEQVNCKIWSPFSGLALKYGLDINVANLEAGSKWVKSDQRAVIGHKYPFYSDISNVNENTAWLTERGLLHQ